MKWADIIQKQGERWAAEREAYIAALTKQIEALDPSVLSDEELIEAFAEAVANLGGGAYGPKAAEQWELSRIKLRDELLWRLSASKAEKRP